MIRSMFTPIPQALESFREGNFLVVLDDEDRENEGDLILAAQDLTAEKMGFLLRNTSGLVCVPMTEERVQQLQLPWMVEPKVNSESHQTAFTVSVDLRRAFDAHMSTGISASDRCRTIQALADDERVSDGSAFARPGHVFPLQARAGGVLERNGHTEAAVDLCRLAGKRPVGVICELTDPHSGEMLRRDELVEFCQKFGLHMITIKALQEYRRGASSMVDNNQVRGR